MQKLLDDAELFSQLCQKHDILAEPDVIQAVKTSCSTGELRLAHTSVIADLCEIIAQVLSSSSTIHLVDLSDCMLLPKGLNYFFKALGEGSSVTSLYLKGNDISGSLVEQLAEVLLRNNTIRVLKVEWNNLGSDIKAFSKFCDALAKNHYIEDLDLRYNQISTQCADSLARALEMNKCLKNLDLAYNSLGISGGQKILQGIKHNNSLVSLNLKVNCLPNDIYSAIKNQIEKNHQKRILFESPILAKGNICSVSFSSEEDDRIIPVKSRIQKMKKRRDRSRTPLEEFRNSPLGGSGNDNETVDGRKTNINLERNFEINDKIEDLHKILQEKSSAFDHIKIELETKTEELKNYKTANTELKSQVEQLKNEIHNLTEEKRKELENVKKVQTKTENEWKESYRELEETHKENVKLKQEYEVKCRELEKEFRKATLEIQCIKEKFTSTVQSYEDTISESKLETHRIRRELQERENRAKIETNSLKETLKETSSALEKCQDQLQKLRNELRESLEIQAKLKLKVDEAERIASRTIKLEECLIKSKDERDKLEEKLQETRKTIASLQKQLIRLQEESIEPQKRYDALKLEFQLEREKTASLNNEIQNERMRNREMNEQVQKMLGQINGLYKQISETQSKNADIVRDKDSEIEKLKNVICQKTRELDEYKSEQVQRAHQFQAAVSKYLGTFGSSIT